MICPQCQAKNKTVDTRQYRDDELHFHWVERRTVCPHCKTVTKTVEVPMFVWDKARTALDREIENDIQREDS